MLTTTIHPPTAAESAVLDRIDGAAMLDRTLAWAAINSGSRNLAGLRAVADAIEPALAALGPVGRLAPTPVDAVDATGTARPLAHGDNLHLVVRPDAPVRVLLTGHIDTVFAADHPFQACRWLDATTVNGPGTADMKGGIAVMLAALEAIEASPFAAGIGYEVVLNSDEEVSSLGSSALLREAALRCHLGLTYEPALPDGTLAGGRKGSGNFAAVVRGTAAHAGREPEKGRNALVAAADLALRLAALVRAGLSVNPARIDGGGPNNIVPDLAVLRFNVRPSTLADQAAAEAAIADAVAAVAAVHDVAITLDGSFARPPKPLDANQRRLFDLVHECGTAIGLGIGWRDTGGVCDGNNLAATGLAVVDTMGVRGGAIHSSDEYMDTASLVERARLSALVLMRVAQSGWTR
ncbi:hydrolase [Polymorphobacter megasporae]|uniref:hydrolase n=1 Tax=Glacieibacterium megasporae TaxID=2835787 RepID=UPI001C1DFBEA|nr:hydrolase [Polymorphobacter megasporae]UAJ10798.1 hydrolase [Polymorphobacter megasporae]